MIPLKCFEILTERQIESVFKMLKPELINKKLNLVTYIDCKDN